MHIYVEKEFFDEFISLDHDDKFVREFYMEMILQISDFTLHTQLSESELELERYSDNPMFWGLTERARKTYYSVAKSDFINNKITIHKLLFVRNTTNNSELGNLFESFSCNNLIDRWKKYSPINNEFMEVSCSKETDFPAEERFSEWSNLNNFCNHPLTEIIIYDRYFLVDEYHQSMEKNLFPMLKEFAKMSQNRLKVKLIVLPDEVMKRKSISTESKLELIKERMDREKLSVELELLLLNDKNMYLQHDRWIYTNLYLLYRGYGFNIFNGQNNISDSSEISFKFIYLKKYRRIFYNRRKIVDKIITSSKKIA
tara:strand:+ start:139 stop:1077 length:939 start_codon:yes stop_codon:yes gene_type:complete